MAQAQALSRKETPGCLAAEQVVQLGITVAARLGILCRPPNLPLENNSFIPMDGDCAFSCFCHANNPDLRGVDLKHEAWALRSLAIGTLIERLAQLSEDQWDLLQAIIQGDDEHIPSKEEIRTELEEYYESGKFSGNVGDIMPQLAADYLGQPLLVIEVEDRKVKSTGWIRPGGLFGDTTKDEACPVVVVLQMKHYEILLVAEEAKETAKSKYLEWVTSQRVRVTENSELDNDFIPLLVSTATKSSLPGRVMSRQIFSLWFYHLLFRIWMTIPAKLLYLSLICQTKKQVRGMSRRTRTLTCSVTTLALSPILRCHLTLVKRPSRVFVGSTAP